MSTLTDSAPLPTTAPAPTPEPDLARRDYVRTLRRITLVILGIGLVARIVRFGLGASLWGDEAALGLNLIRRDFAGLMQTLDWGQVAPLLFLWGERAILLTFGSSEWSVRLLPFLAGVGGLLVFWDFARRVATPTAATLAVGVMAVSRWPVFMSGILKPYSSDLFWSVVLMALAARWRQQPTRLWPLLALVFVVPVALGASFPSVFVAGAVSLYLLPVAWQHPDRRTQALYVGYNLFMLGAFAAVYALMLRQQTDPQAADLQAFLHDYWSHGFPPSDPLSFVWWLVKTHTGRMLSFPIGDGNGGSTLSFLLFAGGIWASWRARNRALVVLCCVPFALNFVAAIGHKYPYGACTRLSMHLAPAICLMIGVGWAAFLEKWVPSLRLRLRFVGVGAVILGILGVGQIAFDAYRPDVDVLARWSQCIARELEHHLQSEDVVVFKTGDLVQFKSGDRVGYEPGNELISRDNKPSRFEPFDWYLARFGERVSWDRIPTQLPEKGRVWLVILSTHRTGAIEEAELLSSLGPEWVTVTRIEYVSQPDPVNWEHRHCTIRCLARASDKRSPPLLRASP